MSDLRFIEENERGLPRKAGLPVTPGFTGFLIRKGLVKSERQANILMVIACLIMIGAIVYININTFGSPIAQNTTAAPQ